MPAPPFLPPIAPLTDPSGLPIAAPIALPPGAQPMARVRMPALPGGGGLPLGGLTVLLVEDSRFTSDAFRLLCRRSGARLRRAESLELARAHLRTYRPDVAIIDLGLPDGRGEALIREIAQTGQGTVALGLSGDPLGRDAALAAGARGFLEKPLPGLAEFQRAVLRHLPDRAGPLAAEEGAPLADPLALRDDLAHAAELLAAVPDAAARWYLAAFVAGVARSAGDQPLAEAAVAAGADEAALPPLRRLVDARLRGGVPF